VVLVGAGLRNDVERAARGDGRAVAVTSTSVATSPILSTASKRVRSTANLGSILFEAASLEAE